METSKEYANNIKNKIITDAMLQDCLYSVNKRAKNCRDKERQYRSTRYEKYGSIERYHEKKEQYYKQKEILLTVLQPKCIHKEFLGYERERIYDYEDEYYTYSGEFIWENCYWDDELGYEVWFGDIELKDSPIFHYYLFYELGNRSFHTPIEEWDVKKYPELQTVEIKKIVTYGDKIQGLVSPQFVRKVISLIESKEYKYVSVA